MTCLQWLKLLSWMTALLTIYRLASLISAAELEPRGTSNAIVFELKAQVEKDRRDPSPMRAVLVSTSPPSSFSTKLSFNASQIAAVCPDGKSFAPSHRGLLERARVDALLPRPRCHHTVPLPSSASASSSFLGSGMDHGSASATRPGKPAAVVIPFRGPMATYLFPLRMLLCTLRRSLARLDAAQQRNYEIVILTAHGDLNASDTAALQWELRRLAPPTTPLRLRTAAPLHFPNTRTQRFGANFFKLRAWELDDVYAAVLLLDADTVVVGSDLWTSLIPSFLVSSGSDILMTLDLDKSGTYYDSLGRAQGGVILLRPCSAVAAHMIHLLESCEATQFRTGWAEQSFLDWYFKFERGTMPSARYNAISHLLDGEGKSADGSTPSIVHFTRRKIWDFQGVERGISYQPWMRNYLCTAKEIER